MLSSKTSVWQTDIHKCILTVVVDKSGAAAISVALMLTFVTAWRELDDFHACSCLPAHAGAVAFHKASELL